jgi:hypothetical protein
MSPIGTNAPSSPGATDEIRFNAIGLVDGWLLFPLSGEATGQID